MFRTGDIAVDHLMFMVEAMPPLPEGHFMLTENSNDELRQVLLVFLVIYYVYKIIKLIKRWRSTEWLYF